MRRKTIDRCHELHTETGKFCRREKDHRGAHRWWVSRRPSQSERCGLKSQRSELRCQLTKGHTGRHRYAEAAAQLPEYEEWFSCENCTDNGLRVAGGSVLFEICMCRNVDPTAHEAAYLSRCLGELIQSGAVSVRVLSSRGKKVRLGLCGDVRKRCLSDE